MSYLFHIKISLSLIMIVFMQIISLSASANKLSDIQNQADEYARQIMEHLDPDNLGFIIVQTTIQSNSKVTRIE